jgi:hypothetical protein
VVLEDINKNYTGSGTLFSLINGWTVNPLNTVSITHVTGFADAGAHIFTIGNQSTNPAMSGFVFTNNLVTTGAYPVWSSGGGNTTCSASDVPVTVISKCFSSYTFANNALIASPKAFPPSTWPTGNFFPVDGNSVGFVQYKDGVGGDYELQPNSLYKSAGTDHRDIGADVAGLEAALAGVE